MTTSTRHVLIPGFALIAAVAGEASAQTSPPPPPACAGAASAYRTGLTLGQRIVTSSWNRVNDCDRIDYFLQVVEDNVSRLTLPDNPSTSTICRYTGTADGVYQALDNLCGACFDQCFIDGEFAGQISGEIYCELSIALDGLEEADDFIRGPVAVCGLSFETGCDAAFIGVTTSYVNDDGACVSYTEGEYERVWDQARNNQCMYEPPPPAPVQPRDGGN
jgi:hypothetical protein